LLKPSKTGVTDDEKLEKVKPTATRNLILIRHGQYNLNGSRDEERFLTALGKHDNDKLKQTPVTNIIIITICAGIEQADCTGKRLKELAMPYSSLVQSSMCRARETAKIISGHLPNVVVKTCDLLQEGAPYPPEPPVGHWKPEYHVSISNRLPFKTVFVAHFCA
jgi:serine/threonine-protein phosphatase PGAM5